LPASRGSPFDELTEASSDSSDALCPPIESTTVFSCNINPRLMYHSRQGTYGAVASLAASGWAAYLCTRLASAHLESAVGHNADFKAVESKQLELEYGTAWKRSAGR
jgi:hypothetical protein